MGCANTVEVRNSDGNLIRSIKSHYDTVEYEELQNGHVRIKAGQNRSAWEYIFPAIFQKMPDMTIHSGNEAD